VRAPAAPLRAPLTARGSYPTDAELLATIRRARADYTAAVPGTPLDVLYVMTEAADGEWWAAFRAALVADGWATIVTTAELELDDEQTEVGMAVDMEIARLADVFVGNGVRRARAVLCAGRRGADGPGRSGRRSRATSTTAGSSTAGRRSGAASGSGGPGGARLFAGRRVRVCVYILLSPGCNLRVVVLRRARWPRARSVRRRRLSVGRCAVRPAGLRPEVSRPDGTPEEARLRRIDWHALLRRTDERTRPFEPLRRALYDRSFITTILESATLPDLRPVQLIHACSVPVRVNNARLGRRMPTDGRSSPNGFL
jgi:hypothetical protein